MDITKKKLLGARIPVPLIIELRGYCKSRGILINHFVFRAIEERLKKVKRSKKRQKQKNYHKLKDVNRNVV